MKSTAIPVRLLLTSSSRDERGEESPPIRILTTGRLKQTPSGFLLRYEESGADATGEMITAPVTLSLQPSRVVMTRYGDFASTMVFVKDTRFEGQYHTPYGNMDLALYTTRLYCRATPEKGTLHLEYQLDMQGTWTSTQLISLNYEAEGAC